MDIFKKQIELIKKNNYKFYDLNQFSNKYSEAKKAKKILLTIDDAFSSFYENAWPFLKEKKIPFILFVSTEPVGKNGYMTWEQIKEIEKEDFVYIGNHSHSHEYMINFEFEKFKDDIDKSIEIFINRLGYNPRFFSYPFGEYSLKQKKYITKRFEFAFGQHSGVIDINKDKYELPRFPINEKYGDLKRFEFLIKLLPLQYKNSYKEIVKNLGFKYGFGQHSGVIDKTKNEFELPRFPINEKYGKPERFKSLLKTIPFPYKNITPSERYLTEKNNPPEVNISFFEDGPDIKNITCYSNEENSWRKSKLHFHKKNELRIILDGKFTTERGRINCSLRESNGNWRWLGIQFVIANK